MKIQAIRMHQTGGPEVLKMEEIELPAPLAKQVLVRLKVAGVNFIDVYFRRGSYVSTLPYIPGFEGAGVVEQVGDAVTAVKPGDHVAFSSQPGSYATAILIDEQKLIPIPKELSFEQAAAFPLQGMTAHYLLHEFYKVKAGSTVLIHAAAGGMGLLLVQWARHLGARVIGTVSTEEKAKAAKEAGAHEIINYAKQDFVAEVKRLTNGIGVDYIIDGVGKTTFPGNLEAVRARGHIVIYGSASGPADPISPNALMSRAITLSGGTLFQFTETHQELLYRANAVLAGLKEGWLKLKIDKVLPLKDASLAHKLLEERSSSGKLLLQID
jgi:NADPH2:quinone reductase